MKTRTVTVREGENVGPINWNYNFLSHFNGYSSTPEHKQQMCDQCVEWLRKMEAEKGWQATTDGGWPRMGWQEVVDVGMYDGWPYWTPVPSVCLMGPLGSEWHSFNSITGAERRKDAGLRTDARLQTECESHGHEPKVSQGEEGK